MWNKRSLVFWTKFFNPIVLMLYVLMIYKVYELSRYGGRKRIIPVVLLIGIFLIGWFIWSFYQNKNIKKESQKMSRKKIKHKKYYLIFALLIITGTSFLTGLNIYKNVQKGDGRLAYYVERYKREKKLVFNKDNLFEDGLDEIFGAIEKEVGLPEELYLATDFELTFRADGQIQSFDTVLYGENEQKEPAVFSITYSKDRSNKIMLYLNQSVEMTFDENRKLNPIFELLNRIELEEKLALFNQTYYQMTYEGLSYHGNDNEGTYFVLENGETININPLKSGYSLLVHDEETSEYSPRLRFIYEGGKLLTDEEYNEEFYPVEEIEWEVGYNYEEGEEAFFLDRNHGYRLTIVDAALGSRFYQLDYTNDQGESWETINENPFVNETGGSAGIKFFDESLGFIALAHQGGRYADLYRTEDGGQSFEKISFPIIERALTEGKNYEPFVFPEMPFEENGELFLWFGQGAEGDYQGGVKALLQSDDQGKTWEFIKEE